MKLTDLSRRLRAAPVRLRVTARVARSSGLVWTLTPAGVRVAARAIFKGQPSPSLVFRVHAANQPERVALAWRDRRLTWRELDRTLDSLAAALVRRGLQRGQRVVLMMRNRMEFLMLQGAITRAGGAAVSVSWRSTPSELAYLAGHCGARFLAVERDLGDVAERAKLEIPKARWITIGGRMEGALGFDDLASERVSATLEDDEEEAAVVVYTSGTTGKQKGAVRKFPKDALASALRFIAGTPMRTDDVHLVACPLYHSTAFGFATLSFLLGATVVVLDEFKPELFLSAIEEHAITTTAVVPTMLHRVLAHETDRYRTRSLRVVFSGGAPLPGPLALAFMDRFGDILFNFYGATETGLVTLATPADLRAAPGTIGRAVDGNEIRLLDDEGRPVRRGEVGELFVKNDLLVDGYHEDEQATRASTRDGFFSVGDLARVDGEGRYFIEGRKRDMIITGGVNVYPAEVEAALEQHPEVAEVAVVGVADPEWGERVVAFVVPQSQAPDAGAIVAFARERLAGPKVPREIRFLEALPRNPTGKVLKRELRG